MNYEKEYKKLKADIEKAYLFAQTDSTKAALEHILPELKESEDERTRKEIIGFLQLPHPQFVGERKQEKWVAWLEKQEQKYSWSYVDEADLNNIIWLCNNCINGSETTWIPSQAIRIKSLIERIKERGLEYQKSTEWNKEDERTYKSVLYAFEHNYPLNHEQQKFIKSLKDRVLPQTKEKWSEEDERIYQSIIDDTVQENQLDSKQIDWLKFLKERYTWKPSKEQMDAMQLAVSCFNCKWTSEVFALLKSLYEDLKKLKG